LNYRKEIDGLRALAVIPVILCHAGIFGFSGGYIGVDIFFVISGYLITSIIFDELVQNKFSIKRFYERRARRILPALSAVLLVTTVLSFIFMPANLLKSYADSLISVVTFTSNFHFFTTSGYFSTLAEQKPLLHTWSLAVEEQFYLFFPLLLSYFWFKGKYKLTKIIFLLTIASLLLCQLLALNSYTDANFYLIFSRAWELFAGALIALTSIDKANIKPLQRDALGITGLALILYAMFVFDENTLFPSFYTLIPVIGSVFIIAFSHSNTLVGKLLSNRLFVTIGLISYSLYLWHQPLFSLLRLKSIGEPSVNLFILAITLTFLLAFLSYRYIEQPFRKKKLSTKKNRLSVLQYAGISISFFIVIGLIGVANRGFQSRFSDTPYIDSIKFSPKRKACHYNSKTVNPPEYSCRYFGKNVTWATLGDSHTVEPAYALARLLKPKNEGILHLSFSGCIPALLIESNKKGCAPWFKKALNYLENNQDINNVLIGFYYNGLLYGNHRKYYPEIPNENPRSKLTDQYQHLTAEEIRELYWQGFKKTVERLLTSGKKVYIQYPIPELPTHISNLLTPFSIFGGGLRYDPIKTTTAEYYFTRNAYILKKLDSLNYGNNLQAIKPFELLCDGKFCPAVKNGKALYFDSGHLSVAGAMILLSESNIVN